MQPASQLTSPALQEERHDCCGVRAKVVVDAWMGVVVAFAARAGRARERKRIGARSCIFEVV